MTKTYELKETLQAAFSEEEIAIADMSVVMALEAGASAVQVRLAKGKTETISLLDGEIDSITQTGDRGLVFSLYAGGRYGIFSTNRLNKDSLKTFLKSAVQNVQMLAPDPYRKLPNPEETAKDAIRGNEVGLCWYGYESVSQEDRIEMAKRVSVFKEYSAADSKRGWRLISEEVEYTDMLTDHYITNSDGLHCRQIETYFSVSSQATIEDADGNKYSCSRWDSGISPKEVAESDCGAKAVLEAASKISPTKCESGIQTMVVSNKVSKRLLRPILSALGGRAIQQKSSFLLDTLDKQVFRKGLNIVDRPREKGKCGATFFDLEGRATKDRDIIADGVVKEYFIGSYMANKMNMKATSGYPIRPVLLPFLSESYSGKSIDMKGLDEREIISLCGDGILVTDFNGGNYNRSTGDFSYGVEGYEFRNGDYTTMKPVSGILITGNFVELWNNLEIAGNDLEEYTMDYVPTLAFSNVNFSA